MNRKISPFDQAIGCLDNGLRLLFGPAPSTDRPNPGIKALETGLSPAARDLAGRLMRVNHAGEICAQALYQGQALTARNPRVRSKLERAAQEENDHLAWTAQRVNELGARTSYLNPVWYAGSFALGAIAGFAGDRWSLGFLAETERQVVEHLDRHLARLPAEDGKSAAIVAQMREDESQHATTAEQAGAAELPRPVKRMMRFASSIMTTGSHWL
jgi:3-demethoxyubiquinol 3-hydroxylase